MTQTTQNTIDPKAHFPFVGSLTTHDFFNAANKLAPGSAFDLSGIVQNSNTFIASPPPYLQPDAVEAIKDTFAPLSLFARTFDPDPMKPNVGNVIKFCSAGSTTLTETIGSPITNYQDGNGTLDPVQVTIKHYSQPWHVTNPQFQSGARIEDFFAENMLILAQTIAADVAANWTTSNYATTVTVPPAASFGLSDLAAAQAKVKKSASKFAVLDAEYHSRITHVAGFDSATNYGWKGLFSQSAGWSSAGAKVRGIATAPQAMVIVTGLLLPMRTQIVKSSYITLGNGLICEFNRWLDTSSRDQWATLDLVLGAAPADTSAAALLVEP